MKLATLHSASPDGQLVVVSKDNRHYLDASKIAPNLLHAIEHWQTAQPKLHQLYDALNTGDAPEKKSFDASKTKAPMPRSWQWLDGSAFPQHGELMQQAFNMPPIESDHPLMYQGQSDRFYGAMDPIPFLNEDAGIDFEGEFAVIVDAVPMGTSADDALKHIKLIVQLNDWSLRAIAPAEMKTGFGFVNAKPPCSMAPVAITPDELGSEWCDARINLPLNIMLNDTQFGSANGIEMEYGFHELISHAAATRDLVAGTIIGSGTVSNKNYSQVGSSCLSEKRAIDMVAFGEIRTPFMSFGDRIRMETTDVNKQPLFGAIDQQVIEK